MTENWLGKANTNTTQRMALYWPLYSSGNYFCTNEMISEVMNDETCAIAKSFPWIDVIQQYYGCSKLKNKVSTNCGESEQKLDSGKRR